jgi:glycosyltransferase involved in cell wall biosynthesis
LSNLVLCSVWVGNLPKTMTPTITIIIPTYNRCNLLHRAIRSALDQSYPACNVLVFDDASTDDTPATAAHYTSDPRFTYMRAPRNLNMPLSWGAALEHATGDYITFLGDDDVLRPDYAHVMVHAVEQAQVTAVFANFDHDREGNLTPALPETRPADLWRGNALVRAALAVEWYIGSTLYRRSDLVRLWPQLVSDGNAFDIGLHLRLALDGAVVAYVPDRHYINTRHTGQVSHNKRATMFADKERVLLALLALPLPSGYRRLVVEELSSWYVVWGNDHLANHDRGAALRKIVAALQTAPSSTWAWRQLLRALIKRP